MENRPKLIVIGSLNYPKGSAPSNRIHLYCKALLQENGCPLVVNLDAPFVGKQEFSHIGRNEGVPFCYSRKSYIREYGFFKRNLQRTKGLITAVSILV